MAVRFAHFSRRLTMRLASEIANAALATLRRAMVASLMPESRIDIELQAAVLVRVERALFRLGFFLVSGLFAPGGSAGRLPGEAAVRVAIGNLSVRELGLDAVVK